MSLVTVYVTNYNYGRYIAEALESILAQSYEDIEIIVIDDGSTDESHRIIEGYAENEKIRIIYQQNKGLNVSNNVALRAAEGKYIMRLDADDFLHPEAISRMVKVLDNDEGLGLVFPDYYYVDENGKIIGQEQRHNFDTDVKLYDQPAHGACTMIRTEYLRQVGGYNEQYNCQDGYELWVKFTQQFKITNLNEPLFYYRRHGSNLTRNENKILKTRALMNSNFIRTNAHSTETVVIIPVRGGSNDLAFREIGGENILRSKIKMLQQTSTVRKIVVSSPDQQVKDLITDLESERVIFHSRTREKARLNISLDATVMEIIESEKQAGHQYKAAALVTLEYPFLEAFKVDDAIHTLILFGADSLIGVRPDNSIFYQHHGDGLHPILNREKYTKLEREALFKQAGGITAVTISSFLSSKKVVNGMLGHIVIDQKSSLGLFSDFDFELAESLYKTAAV